MDGRSNPAGRAHVLLRRGVHDQCGQRSVLFTDILHRRVISIDNSPAQNSVAYLPYTGELILDGPPFRSRQVQMRLAVQMIRKIRSDTIERDVSESAKAGSPSKYNRPITAAKAMSPMLTIVDASLRPNLATWLRGQWRQASSSRHLLDLKGKSGIRPVSMGPFGFKDRRCLP